jgi:hypothetical protein
MRSAYLREAFKARNGGAVVVTGLGHLDELGLAVGLFDPTMLQRGSSQAHAADAIPEGIPHQVELY